MKTNGDRAKTQEAAEPDFELLLDYLKRTRGFDFTGYKRSSLMRRVEKRMSQIPIESFSEYVDYLEVHQDEFEQLFNTILINVTAFFRDEETWEYLRAEIIPQLITNNPQGQIRIWCAGCASGEEAYSIAMLLCDALGTQVFRERVKIYATDVDDEALAQSRAAVYSIKQLENVPEALRERYFTAQGNELAFNPELRRSVIFGRHDLVQDAPISRLDLLLCRNTLMYLNAETQHRILARFHFGLKEQGYLLLGKAEMLLSHSNLFSQVGLTHRVFSRANHGGQRDHARAVAAEITDGASHGAGSALKAAAFEKALPAQIMIDDQLNLVAANERARSAFAINSQDVRRPLQDLEISFRPVELRSLIESAYNDNRVVRAPKVEHRNSYGESIYYEIEVSPLYQPVFKQIGAIVSFHDRTTYHVINDSLQVAHQELETTNEELQSTNEELETTNEELQSTNEELETTNEELQSANEELETTNEELQSTNEELEAINSDLIALTDEADHTNLLLQEILSSLNYGVAVLDDELNILVWSRRCEDMWGLRADEVVGRNFLSLEIGLPVAQLEKSLRNCLDNDQTSRTEVMARNRRGKQTQCVVNLSPLMKSSVAAGGIVVQMDDRQAES